MPLLAPLTSILMALLLLGCGGRAPNPVMVQQYDDERRSCHALERELVFIEGEIQRLMPQTEKTGKNVALAISGYFLLVPWLYMDLSKAEQMEVDAYRQRYNRLLILSEEKGCGIAAEPIPEFQTSPPEVGLE
jgi:hypothetical protein